jgi:hypothetical protein
MPTPIPKHVLEAYCRALAVLAGAPDGCTEAIMLAHGFEQDLLVEMARDGLATVSEEPLRVGERSMMVFRLRITNTGRQALVFLRGAR